MKRTIKNLFSAPTDSRTGGARLGARMLPAPTHLRRTATNIGSAKTLNVPDGITTFKVYDDNGKSSNYSDKYTGYLVITAPTGSVLQLSGSIVTEEKWDKLTVYDNGTAVIRSCSMG